MVLGDKPTFTPLCVPTAVSPVSASSFPGAARGLLWHCMTLAILGWSSSCSSSLLSFLPVLDNWKGNQKVPLVLWGPVAVLTVQLLGAPLLRQHPITSSHIQLFIIPSSCQNSLLSNLMIVSLSLPNGSPPV